MHRSWWWRFSIIVLVTVGSLWFLIPSYYSFFKLPKAERNNLKLLQEKLPSWAPSASHRLNLGLDLQGGIYMVMRVDTKTALQKRVERSATRMVASFHDRKIAETTADANPEKLEVALTVKDPSKMDTVQSELGKYFGEFTLASRQGNIFLLDLKSNTLDRFKEDSVEQAMLVIRRRIDKWGVAEVDVRRLGTDAIQLSLPGQKDPEQAREVIGKTAQLEFRMVDDKSPVLRELFSKSHPPDVTITEKDGFPQLIGTNRESLLAYVQGAVPADRQVLLECQENPLKKGSCTTYRTYLVDKAVPLTGDSLAEASVQSREMGKIAVSFQLDAQGARDFEELTAKNVGRKMAIVLDDTVNSAPVIREKIPGGNGQIELGGGYGKSSDEQLQEAQTLVLTLQAGALPAPVTVGEIRQVGASLGDELIKKGSLAALVGLAFVVLFMAVYYRKSGLVADVALVLNGILILAGLALFNATLTLPGIAGFVLTLGIAVDANVLINERVREELRHGKTARAAVDQGYDRAFWTIFDAHVTTLIAGFILLSTGTGPVRGFATSLIIGLLASLFTSIVVTRVITTYFIHGRNAQTVSV